MCGTNITIDVDLVKKHDVAGPRYTSYPTALHFREDTELESIDRSVRADLQNAEGVSLYFHIPFCDTLCWFCGCTTIISRKHEVTQRYMNALKMEMDLFKKQFGDIAPVEQIHLGGGTPSYLSPDELRALGNMIHERFTYADDMEFGVEIDPRGLTRDHIRALAEIGGNRISMGVQDHNPDVQKAVNRIQPKELTKKVIKWIRDEGFLSLNLDLIYGLPLQTASSFESTLKETVALSPDRLAVFNYAHVPWIKPHQKLIANKGLPPPHEKLKMLKTTIEYLTANGYVYIGMDHFAKESDDMVQAQRNKTLQRNFQGYSTRGGRSIYAFGMSAISQTPDAYYQNEKDLNKYEETVGSGKRPVIKGVILSDDDKIRRYVIMRVMCDLSLDYDEVSRKFDIAFREVFKGALAALEPLESDGLVKLGKNELKVTDTGRLFLRNIAMCFDPYVKKYQNRYSRTV